MVCTEDGCPRLLWWPKDRSACRSAGFGSARFHTEKMNQMLEAEMNLRKTLTGKLSPEILEKLEGVYSDAECCKILAENGVNLDEFEQTIADHGFDMHKIGLQLPDSELGAVTGGFYDKDYQDDLDCPYCGDNNRDNFSRQFWRSLCTNKKSFYCCK